MSRGLEGAGEQRLHIYKAETEIEVSFLSPPTLSSLLNFVVMEQRETPSVLTLELQHHITQVRLDVELIVRRQHQTETRHEPESWAESVNVRPELAD